MSLDKALQNNDVVNSLIQAWVKTHKFGHEYGGWIFKTKGGKYTTQQKTDNQSSSITLTKEKDLLNFKGKGYIILAQFHCHPGKFPTYTRPSDGDMKNAEGLKYPSIVFTYKSSCDYSKYKLKCIQKPCPNGFPNDAVMWYA